MINLDFLSCKVGDVIAQKGTVIKFGRQLLVY